MKTIYLGAGCFWHVQEVFDSLVASLKTEVGYMGGDEKKYPNPSYKEVCSDKTGYIEVVKIEYTPSKIKLKKILEKFWEIHDPTSLDKQGADIGTQYKSIIFYTDNNQKIEAQKNKEQKQKDYSEKIVTEIKKARTFFRAENYHQKYYKNIGFSCRIN
jgi:peptide-methionine (S)-S-oxide reductase